MAFGGGLSDGIGSPVACALDQLSVGVDHLVKLVEDGGLDALDTVGFVGFVPGLERVRNRLRLNEM